MPKFYLKSWLLCGAAGLGLAVSTAAHAQPAQPSAVQEVVVTAQRRAERLEDVPMSITAVTAESIENAAVTSIHELGSLAPSVRVEFAGIFTQPAIRGISSLTNGVGFENNVAIYVDGFYAPDMMSLNGDMANIASIEVLKGPQGALYGRNATGGAILINTLAPSETFTGKIEGSYASFDDKSISGYLSGPITDRMRYSLAAYARHTDGYLKLQDPLAIGRTRGDAVPMRNQSVRGKLEVDVTDDLTATLGYNYGLADDNRTMFTPVQYISAAIPGPPLRGVGYRVRSYNGTGEALAIVEEGTLKLAFSTPIGALTSYTSYGHRRTTIAFDFDGTYAPIVDYSYQRYQQDTFQQGVDFAVTAIRNLDLVIGGQYFNDRTKNRPDVGTGSYNTAGVLTRLQQLHLRGEAFAIYADATYHFSDRLSLTLGGRYTDETKEMGFFATNGAPKQFIFPPTDKKTSFNKFTPRASVRYQIAERTNIYASYSRGFRSGAFNANGAATPALLLPIEPETVTAYEVGFKTAQDTFRFDIAAFYIDDKNLHVGVTVPNPLCPAGQLCPVVTLVSNAPKAEAYGVDGDLTVTPIDGLNIRLGFAYLHARYKDFPFATGTGVNAVTGFTVPGQIQDWSNKQMARSPTWSGNLGADYEVPLMGGDLKLAANLTFSASYVIQNPSLYGPLAGPTLAGKQRLRQSAYTLLNAQASWTDPSGHYTFSVFGRNITDTKYRANYNSGGFGDYTVPNWPRQIGAKVGYAF